MLYSSINAKKGEVMSEQNKKSDFIKGDDERFSPDIVFGKKKSNSTTSENNTDATLSDESALKKSKFRLWTENFFYHYKWHSIVALFLVCVILFCTLQTCTKTTFDSYVIYAGGKNLRVYDEAAGETLYRPLCNAIGRYTEDFDGDGNRHVSFLDIYLPSGEEIDDMESEGNTPNPTLLKENKDTFDQHMLYGEYYICIISKDLFAELTKDKKTNPLREITPYLPENAKIATNKDDTGYLLASEYGVYLSSTPLADRPGFKHLPNDTVITFRMLSDFAAGKKRTKQRYANAEETLRMMLSDTAFS